VRRFSESIPISSSVVGKDPIFLIRTISYYNVIRQWPLLDYVKYSMNLRPVDQPASESDWLMDIIIIALQTFFHPAKIIFLSFSFSFLF
jgi:hypothetical protein